MSDFHPAVWDRGSLHRVSLLLLTEPFLPRTRVLPRGQKSCHVVLELVISFDWHKWVAFYAWWCKNKQLTVSRNRVLKHACKHPHDFIKLQQIVCHSVPSKSASTNNKVVEPLQIYLIGQR